MASSGAVLLGLWGANAGLYALLLVNVFRGRRQKAVAANLAEAFRTLEAALKHGVPDLPAGFTWEEAMARLNVKEVDSKAIGEALKSYEAYRYGGLPLPDSDYKEIVRVANLLGGSNPGVRN
jgi:hypothetical protein